jgi:hypothetical protein
MDKDDAVNTVITVLVVLVLASLSAFLLASTVSVLVNL